MMKNLNTNLKEDFDIKKTPLNQNSAWVHSIENGQQPSGNDLLNHLDIIHNNNAGFTETIAWNCRDAYGKNSYELLLDMIDLNDHSKVIDLACGSGVLLDLCDQHFDSKLDLLGIDICEAELKLARKRLYNADVKLRKSMAQDLSFIDDRSVDIVLCHWALTLMDPVLPVFKTVKRILKKGGVFTAIVDGDSQTAPGYSEIHNIIYKFVQEEFPNYGEIEIGDPRVRLIKGLNELSEKAFDEPKINITQHVLSFNAPPRILAREVAGFFYASFVLSLEGKAKMLIELENYFSNQFEKGLCFFFMPVNRLTIKKD